jgi:hypothetical protein
MGSVPAKNRVRLGEGPFHHHRATSLVSQSWRQVSGVIPSIWTSDPEASDANRISERRDPQLKPGR